MARKKIDRRILNVIERATLLRHRCMFLVCGLNSREQVPILHHLLVQCRRAAGLVDPPAVLWFFKKEAGLGGHHQRKRLKRLRKRHSSSSAGGDSASFLREGDALDHFLSAHAPLFCHYGDVDRVLGRTCGLLVLQDFEALTPNLLARVTESVEGGGMVLVLLAHPITHLPDLKMDAHARYATESHAVVTPLFNRRFVLSLATCPACIVLDDGLRVRLLPQGHDGSSDAPHLDALDRMSAPSPFEMERLFADTPMTEQERSVFSLCRTDDQLRALRCLRGALPGGAAAAVVVSLTSGRGRGKSAVLGLAVSLALASGNASIRLTSPLSDNIQTLLAFAAKGLDAIGWVEGKDYRVIRGESGLATCVRVLRRGGGGRSAGWSPPTTGDGGGADVVVVDEAAAIPLPLVRKWVRPYSTVFMASTVQGYEGTGRSLSLKLLNELRSRSIGQLGERGGEVLREVQLHEAVRYSNGDPLEAWLSGLLCLEDPVAPTLHGALPRAQDCRLYSVDRAALFGGSRGAEPFLHRLVSLFSLSHYRNSPDDLLMAADAPAHRLFCLMAEEETPLCAIQVSLEGGISSDSSHFEQANGRRASGDLIPWIVSQQFQDKDFPSLSSARIVRIATRPDCQGMGYGQRVLQLLSAFYSASEKSRPISEKNALLLRLEEVHWEEPLDYLGVSYGLTSELLKFWKRAGFVPLYIRQTTSDVTGEHSCVMVKCLRGGAAWSRHFSGDFAGRFSALLSTAFRRLPSPTAVQVLQAGRGEYGAATGVLESAQLRLLVSQRSLLRLAAYCRGEVDYRLVLDLLPLLAPLQLLGGIRGPPLPTNQECVLVGVGLQDKSTDELAAELCVEPPRVMGLFKKALKRMLATLTREVSIDQKPMTSVRNDVTDRKRSSEDTFHVTSKRFKWSIGPYDS